MGKLRPRKGNGLAQVPILPGGDQPRTRQTSGQQPVLFPLHPASYVRGSDLAPPRGRPGSWRGEGQVQITSISPVAKKEVETILPSCPQGAQLQEATENAGRLNPCSEKHPPVQRREKARRQWSAHSHLIMLITTTLSHIPPK